MANLYDVFVKIPTKNLTDAFTYSSEDVIAPGSLVKVDFRKRPTFGIVSSCLKSTNIPKEIIQPIKKVLSQNSIIHERAFTLAKWISSYYATPMGEVLFSMLPIPEIAADYSKPLTWQRYSTIPNNIHIGGSFPNRLMQYTNIISKTIALDNQVLLLFANYRLVDYATKYFSEILGAEYVTEISDRLGRKEFRKKLIWLQKNKIKLVIGTRKSIFLPFDKLNAIIIDQPANYGYFNDQKPAYTSTNIAWQLSKLFNIRLILGDNLPDLESIYQARRRRLNLITTKNKNSAKLIWQVSSADKIINESLSDLNLIITPFLNSLDDSDYGISVKNIARNIKHDHTTISSKEHNFKLPNARSFTVIATKKIIDYPELIFDKVIIVGADLWLSLPSYDAIQDFVSLVWQVWQQTRSELIIQSAKPLPLVERLLGQRPGKSLAQFMQARQKFNLPPYRREIIIKTKHPEDIVKLLPIDSHPVSSAGDVTAYFKPQNLPLKNINELYRKSEKIVIDPPR